MCGRKQACLSSKMHCCRWLVSHSRPDPVFELQPRCFVSLVMLEQVLQVTCTLPSMARMSATAIALQAIWFGWWPRIMASSASDSPVASAASLVEEFCGPCKSLSAEEVRALARVCESCKELLARKARQVVLATGGEPVLVSYSSDGTPIQTTKRFSASAGGERKVARTGKGTDEYLVQHAFVRFIDGAGQHHSSALLADP
eukprot:12404415-Alexandrium_andersonii.AAC.1